MNKRALGIGLFELLLGLVLTSFLLSVLFRHVLLMKRHAMYLHTLLIKDAEVMQLTSMMRFHIRQAGFTPCANIDHLISLDQRQSTMPLQAISVQEGLSINRMSSTFTEISLLPSRQQFWVKDTLSWNLKHPILIADCRHAEVHTLASFRGRYMVLNKNVSFQFEPPIYVGEWLTERFFIKQKALYYQGHHVDQFLGSVHHLSAKKITPGHGVAVTLGLDNADQTLTFNTWLRAP